MAHVFHTLVFCIKLIKFSDLFVMVTEEDIREGRALTPKL